MTQIIPNGGSRSQQDQYVGEPNEVTVDESNHDLRLHDGATKGGWRLPNIDSLIKLFQPKSDELEGLSGFKPGAKGLLVRLGAAAYAIRSLKGSDEILIDEPLGENGNPTLSLASTIKKAMTFTESVTFGKALVNEQGFEGPTTGTHTGDTNGKHTGAVDVRGKSLQLDDDQIPLSAVNGLAEGLSGLVLPNGMIVMWGGTLLDIPQGWRLCDGANGTPNLTDRFILGAHPDRPPHGTGGFASHSHLGTIQPNGEHAHAAESLGTALTVGQMPKHNHANGMTDNQTTDHFPYGAVAAPPPGPWKDVVGDRGGGAFQGLTSEVGNGETHSHGVTMELDGEHTHAIEIGESSSMPPYYRLAYIMKIA